MAKVKDYFSHDYHARTDLRGIQKDFGLEGVGFYWCLVEILHENGGSIKASELEGIAYELHVSAELCTKVVNDYGKFTVKGGKISCDRVLRNLKKRDEISEVRRKAAEERWGASEEEAPAPAPDEEASPLGTAFVSADARHDFKKNAQWYIDYFKEKIAQYEEESGYDLYDPIAHTGSVLINLIKAIAEYPKVTVARRKIDSLEVMQTLQYFVRIKERVEELESIISEVNEKHENGRIRNKQSYLISALYQAAKVNGG